MAKTIGDNATTLSALSAKEGILPKPMASEIITKAYGESLAGRLAGTTPMPMTGTTLAFSVGEPVAGVVGEGELKPVVSADVRTKTAKPIKIAAIAYWSKEAAQANPAAYVNVLQNTIKDAVRRAIDLAVFHGKDGITGSTIAGIEYLTQTENSVELGNAAVKDGGLTKDILDGYDLVLANGGDVTGFAADSRMRTKLMGAVDLQGRPIYTNGQGRGGVDLSDAVGDLLGLPVAYGKAVAGNLGVVEDSGIRLIGGDFKDNLKLGYVEQITYRKTDVGTIKDGNVEVNLFQQNMEAYLVECLLGWVIKDVNDFVTYTFKDTTAKSGS